MAQSGLTSKLDELADKADKSTRSTDKSTRSMANQALRDDIFAFLNSKFEPLMSEIKEVNKKLTLCKTQLQECQVRENLMLERIKFLENKLQSEQEEKRTPQKDFFLVGSSILREVQKDDIQNGVATSIKGGKINDVKETIKRLDFIPKTIVTQIGGNDLDDDETSVESVSASYVTMLTEAKERFPESELIVSGLPPRFRDDKIRTKVKDLNESIRSWANENQISFISVEDEFELKSGEVDSSAYIMTGEMPKLHLNLQGTIRMLKHLQKYIPKLKLSEMNTMSLSNQRTYANVVADTTRYQTQRTNPTNKNRIQEENSSNVRRRRGCFNCAEKNHTVSQCKYGQKVHCYRCRRLGHKQKFCEELQR